jgi:hypothetical protein
MRGWKALSLAIAGRRRDSVGAPAVNYQLASTHVLMLEAGRPLRSIVAAMPLGNTDLRQLLLSQRVNSQALVRGEKLPDGHPSAGLAPLDKEVFERRNIRRLAGPLIVR